MGHDAAAAATDLIDRLETLCDEAIEAAQAAGAEDLATRALATRQRLGEPLRVAIAGRVKAGKSTLLNALVGERLAPTDAGECTRIVTWYQEGLSYGVTAVLADGPRVELSFHRGDTAMDVDLGGRTPSDLAWMEVRWPSSRLGEMTLIDTPGMEGTDPGAGRRTLEFLGVEDEAPGEADAVVYLMRRLHPRDAGFLESFADERLGSPTPVNALAVLSRADEVGAGRLDAMASARDIAERYADDPRLRGLCATVLPVAGLIAESAQTLREDEARALVALSELADEQVADLVLSADRFRSEGALAVSVSHRSALLDRLGLFGVRLCLDALRGGRAETGADLARLLTEASGIDDLRASIVETFGRRARTLKARSTLMALRTVAADLAVVDADRGRALTVAVERVEAGTHEFAELRLLQMLATGVIEATEEERAEIDRLSAPGSSAGRLGLADGTPLDEVRIRALEGVERWRGRAADPMGSRVQAEAAETVAHSYERVYASTV